MFHSRQRGSALILATFVLTVMLLLGTTLVRTLNQESVNVGVEVTNTRAWAAAQSGVDRALARTLGRDTLNEDGATACAAVVGSITPGAGLPDSVAFDRCNVQLSCTHTGADPSDDAANRYEIRARASCGPEMLRVTRTIEALAYD